MDFADHRVRDVVVQQVIWLHSFLARRRFGACGWCPSRWPGPFPRWLGGQDRSPGCGVAGVRTMLAAAPACVESTDCVLFPPPVSQPSGHTTLRCVACPFGPSCPPVLIMYFFRATAIACRKVAMEVEGVGAVRFLSLHSRSWSPRYRVRMCAGAC